MEQTTQLLFQIRYWQYQTIKTVVQKIIEQKQTRDCYSNKDINLLGTILVGRGLDWR